MRVTVSSRHTEVSDSLRAAAVEKIGRLQRFLEGMDSAEVHFSEEKNRRIADREICEVTLAGHGHHIRCKVAGAGRLGRRRPGRGQARAPAPPAQDPAQGATAERSAGGRATASGRRRAPAPARSGHRRRRGPRALDGRRRPHHPQTERRSSRRSPSPWPHGHRSGRAAPRVAGPRLLPVHQRGHRSQRRALPPPRGRARADRTGLTVGSPCSAAYGAFTPTARTVPTAGLGHPVGAGSRRRTSR